MSPDRYSDIADIGASERTSARRRPRAIEGSLVEMHTYVGVIRGEKQLSRERLNWAMAMDRNYLST